MEGVQKKPFVHVEKMELKDNGIFEIDTNLMHWISTIFKNDFIDLQKIKKMSH